MGRRHTMFRATIGRTHFSNRPTDQFFYHMFLADIGR